MNQRQSSRFVFRIQNADQFDQFIRLHGVTDFQADRVSDSPKIFHMRTVKCACAVADPGHVRAKIVPAAISLHAGECLLERQQQAFVRREEIDARQLREFAGRDSFHKANRIAQ